MTTTRSHPEATIRQHERTTTIALTLLIATLAGAWGLEQWHHGDTPILPALWGGAMLAFVLRHHRWHRTRQDQD